MFPKRSLFCPVCDSALGYLTKGENCSFVCKDCKWIFTWDRNGNLRAPTKLTEKHEARCGCGICGR